MHKAYKDVQNYQKDIINSVFINLALIGKKNQQYLENKVESDVAKAIQKYDLTGSAEELMKDTAYLYDEIGGYLGVGQLNTVNSAINQTMGKTSLIVANAPSDVRMQFSAMHNRVNTMVSSGLSTVDQAVRIVKRNYVGQTIRYSNGNNYPIDSYLKMLYKTNQRAVCELRANEVMQLLETDLFEYSSHSEPRDACSNVQGKICSYNSSGYTKDGRGKKVRYYNLTTSASYGQAYGAQGVNCTHLIFAFIPGVSVRVGDKRNPIKEMAGDEKETKLTKDVTKKRKAQEKAQAKTKGPKVEVSKEFLIKYVSGVSQADLAYWAKELNSDKYNDACRYMFVDLFTNWGGAFKVRKGKGSYFAAYDPKARGPIMQLSNTRDIGTLVHEVGHAFDYEKNGATNKFNIAKDFQDFYEVKNAKQVAFVEELYYETEYAKKNKEIADLVTELNTMENRGGEEWLAKRAHYDVLKAELDDIDMYEIGALTDIADAMSKGKLAKKGIPGHGSRYFKDLSNAYAETYTNMLTYYYTGNEERLEQVKKVMGDDLYKFFEDRIKENNKYL